MHFLKLLLPEELCGDILYIMSLKWAIGPNKTTGGMFGFLCSQHFLDVEFLQYVKYLDFCQ